MNESKFEKYPFILPFRKKKMNLQTIIDTLKGYTVAIEYQGVEAIEEDNKVIYQKIPFRPDATMYFVWYLNNPKMPGKTIEKQSQQYLKEHPSSKSYLENYLEKQFHGLFADTK